MGKIQMNLCGSITLSCIAALLCGLQIESKLSQKRSLRRTGQNLQFTNNDKLILRSIKYRVEHNSICVTRCTESVQVGERNRVVAKYISESKRCECYSLQESQLTLKDFSKTTKLHGAIFSYSAEIHPSATVENPCESGTHSCEGNSVCSFDGVHAYCLCPPGLNGHGILCTSYQSIGPTSMSLLNATIERGDPDFLFDLNVHEILRIEFDPLHCVAIEPTGEGLSGGEWNMRLDLAGSERHYVKAVGFNNRKDHLAELLHPNYTTVSVCDFHGCLECEGAEENVTLRGDGGWNYVMCELIGFYILVEVKEDDGSIIPNITLGICEIEILGQKVSPGGKIVVPLKDNLTNNLTPQLAAKLKLALNKVDRFERDLCFPITEGSNRGQYIRRTLEFQFPAEKFVGYIQLLAPYDDSENIEPYLTFLTGSDITRRSLKLSFAVNMNDCKVGHLN
ncbi:uncharacterized protein LOC142338491 [Convolutriloba macropyga]|uniref:uncharacterized protein LOC142338491 n=1 Tax=Convolutriloba macropyga TaxID=536237 RepID=UPI003F522B4B